MLLLHLSLKRKNGDRTILSKFNETQTQINNWFAEEAEKVKLQSDIDDVTQSEKVLLYHHELHRKHIKKSMILELLTDDGLVTGHEKCAEVLSDSVRVFLSDLSPLDASMQDALLEEVDIVFNDDDNEKWKLLKLKRK